MAASIIMIIEYMWLFEIKLLFIKVISRCPETCGECATWKIHH